MIKLFIVVFTLFCHVAFPVKHSLTFMFTGLSGVPNVPEFVGVVKVDDTEMIYCDYNIMRAQPKQDWQKIFMDKSAELTYLNTHCIDRQQFFRENIRDLMKHRSQTGGVHTFQRMYGCECDDEAEEVNVFDQFGYDGEDFEFNRKAETWTEVNQRNLDNEKINIRIFHTRGCIVRLKKYLDYGRNFLQKTELPSVSLLQKTPSSPVTCLATGFYPDRAHLFWRKDGEVLHEDKNNRLILPNHDGTFQCNVILKLSSVKSKDWKKYDCVFQLSGVKDVIITKLDKTAIKSNSDYYICKTPDETNTHITVAVLIFTVFLILILIFIAYKTLTASDDQTQQPSNQLKCASIAALVVALILIVLNGVLYKINEDLHISLPSDYVLKWTEPLPGKAWNL